jgi:hypothetical protein
MRYLTIRKFAAESGYTEAAIRAKISGGVWLLNAEWRRAPDGRVLIDVEGYEAWVERGKTGASRSKSRQRIRLGNGSGSPPPLV